MDTEKLAEIRIAPTERRRTRRAFWWIIGTVAVITLTAFFAARPRPDERRVIDRKPAAAAEQSPAPVAKSETASTASVHAPPQEGTVLTVSGYIVNRERIELSPRFQGVVKWIGVKKGDRVARDQVVVTLDDAEQRARLLEAQGRLAAANAALEKANLNFDRVRKLTATRVVSGEIADEARILVATAKADLLQAEGLLHYAQAQLDWTVIKSPIDGVVLEKLVDPGELVTPQSFGGTRGPSTALIALADPADLQVEIDVNEADLPKIRAGQKCRVSPEAYPDKVYDGYVAELAPEANRQKGTLQIKVQVVNPDEFLTPELSARVDFLK
jgi:HlyD family secretion protein